MVYTKRCDLAIYRNYRINIVVADTIQEGADKYLKDGMVYKNCDGMFAYNSKDFAIGYIFISPKSSIGSVAHECLHAVCKVMTDIGGALSEESEESYAYLLSYLVDGCMNAVDKYIEIRDKDNKE